MKKLIFILSLFWLNAHGTNYYVSASGSDAANGTSPCTAWLTIAKINSSSFQPGDVILFRRGDMWREQLTIPSSGVSGNPITFTAYGTGAKPIFNGADVITTFVNVSGNVWSVDNPNATTSRAMVIVAGTIFSEVTSQALVNSAAEYFIDLAATPDKLYIYSVTNPNSVTTEVSKRDFGVLGVDASLRHHVNFTNLEMRYAGFGGMVLYATQNAHFNASCIIDSCIFYANRLVGFDAYDGHDNDLVRNSSATYNGNGFYAWISDGATFKNCYSAHNIYYSIGAGTTDGHGYGGYQANNWVVEGCTSDDDNDAIHADAGGTAANAIIRYNKIYNSRAGSPSTPGMGVGSLAAGATIQIYYNLIVNCASNGFESWTASAGQVYLYNNTIYLADGYGTDGTVYLNYATNFTFKNNIIARAGSDSKRLYFFQNPGLPTSDYNQFYQAPASAYRWSYNGVNYATIALWRTATSLDANSAIGDPLFMNVASDWRLAAGSPCINAGTPVGLTRDLLGNPIIGLPDRGAYERE